MRNRYLENVEITLVGPSPDAGTGGIWVGGLISMLKSAGARINLLSYNPSYTSYSDKFKIQHKKIDNLLCETTIIFPTRWPRFLKGLILLLFNFAYTWKSSKTSHLVYAIASSTISLFIPVIIAAELRGKPIVLDYFDIESGSEKVLRSMRKSFKPQEPAQAIKMARKAGIDGVEGFFMVGNWDETIRDLLKTWRFILCNNVEPALSIYVPFPGTDFYHLVKQNGYIGDDPDWNSFNQVTPITRTNRMSKLSITVVYVFSIFLKLILAFVRGRNARQTMSQKIMPHLLDKIKQHTGRIGATFGKN